MDPMQSSEVVYFYSDQLAVVFHTNLDPITLKQNLHTTWPGYQEALQTLLQANPKTSHFELKPFQANEVPHTRPHGKDDLADLPGVYVFHTPTDKGTKGSIVAFFHIVASEMQMQQAPATDASGPDNTLQSVILQLRANGGEINNHPDRLTISSTPHWLLANVSEIIHGCPIAPPIPVEEPQASGQWTLPLDLAEPDLQKATGKGMTVFVLDAFPRPERVKQAASAAGDRNLLLQTLAKEIAKTTPNGDSPSTTLTYVDLPPSSTTAATGKDVTGQLVGFPMADHGMFITGIIRELAPGANIECIRILNDFGVGDAIAMVDALYNIQNRLLTGDLQHRSVVVNLSLVSMPPEGTLSALGLKEPPFFDPNLATELRDILFTPLKSLAALGVIFVTAAGNDSDPRDTSMNSTGGHFVARYPAYFANENDHILAPAIIPVGAVNQQGEAAAYSNYPGPNGIATYAGDLPAFLPRTPSPDNPSEFILQMPVDALCGIYSASHYPVLSKGKDLPQIPTSPDTYPQYAAHNQNSWAYWSGTSFATPIITALAARALEQQAPNGDNIRHAISAAAMQEATWTRIQPYDQGPKMDGGQGTDMANTMPMPPTQSAQSANVPVIMAHQQWQPARKK